MSRCWQLKYFFIVNPEPCKNGIQFDEHIFQKWVGSTTNQDVSIFPIFGGFFQWSQLPAVTVRFFRYPSPEVSAFRAELKLGDFGWAAIAAPEGKVSKPPPTGEVWSRSGGPGV